MNAMEQFFATAQTTVARFRETQWDALATVAGWLGDALARDGWLYVFGTGHSHLVAEEVFYRAGGLAHAVPMLDPRIMVHENAIQATYTERESGFAAGLLAQYPVAAGDVLIVVSNSGRNAVPIEMALLGREKGMRVAALLNRTQSDAWPSRHPSGKKLADVAEVVIDNCGPNGDAWLRLPGMPDAIGSTSSMVGLLAIQLILVQAVEHALARGVTPEMYISSNTQGYDHNDRLLQKYKSRIRHL
ncbi:MAG: SIS domain-containing protein [Verrucomicrobiales bacterium]|nr:SIS domain-containing protein [Verrucomicrobiales bacterium]